MFASIQRRFIFPGAFIAAEPKAGEGISGLERLWLEHPDGRVEAWFLPAIGKASAPVVIFAHGNGELIDYWPAVLHRYRELGYHVLLPEYRSYGRSGGSPSQDAIVGDFTKFYDLVAARQDVTDFVFHGRSLGGGVICALSIVREARALVLESTFTSMSDMLALWLIPSFMVADPFDNIAAMRSFSGPSLVLHGSHDSLVPPSHGRSLAEAAKNGRLVMFDADHNDFPPDRAAYWAEIEEFLR